MIEDLKQVRDALELCRFSLEPYDDIKPRDWSTDRQNLRFAHEDAKKALATLDRIIADHIADAGKMVVPDGYKLVPIEPTDDYVEDVCLKAGVCGGIFDSVHTAMLSAAPTPAQPEKVDVEALKRDIPDRFSMQDRTDEYDEGYRNAIDHLSATGRLKV